MHVLALPLYNVQKCTVSIDMRRDYCCFFCVCVQWGESPLIAASYNGHQKCVNSLIEAGARVNIQNEVSFNSTRAHTPSPSTV